MTYRTVLNQTSLETAKGGEYCAIGAEKLSMVKPELVETNKSWESVVSNHKSANYRNDPLLANFADLVTPEDD